MSDNIKLYVFVKPYVKGFRCLFSTSELSKQIKITLNPKHSIYSPGFLKIDMENIQYFSIELPKEKFEDLLVKVKQKDQEKKLYIIILDSDTFINDLIKEYKSSYEDLHSVIDNFSMSINKPIKSLYEHRF